MYHGYEIKLNERLDLEVRRIYVLDTHLYPKQEVPPPPKKNHSFIFQFFFSFENFERQESPKLLYLVNLSIKQILTEPPMKP